MSVKYLEIGLKQLLSRFMQGQYRILDASAEPVLSDALTRAKKSHASCVEAVRARPRDRHTWKFAISPDSPLQFVRSEESSPFQPVVDLFCEFTWEYVIGDGRFIRSQVPTFEVKQQNVVLRIWSDVLSHIFRENLDSDHVMDQLTAPHSQGRRVMARWHFDIANRVEDGDGNITSVQPGPKYHLQFGGKPQEKELAWHPEALDLPRLLHPPLDLFLAIELIAANFFPLQYSTLAKEMTWHGVIQQSQSTVLRSFYSEIVKNIEDGKSVLLGAWNNP